MIHVRRYIENPLIQPEDVKPIHPGFEVIGAFNAGIASFHGETLLLLRVAERPVREDPSKVPSPYYDEVKRKVVVKNYDLQDPELNFEDSRTIRLRKNTDRFVGLTSLSYLRLARSRDGRHFTVDDQPFIYPCNRYQTFGIEDPRITQMGDTYAIYFSAVSAYGIGVGLVTTKDFKHYDDRGLIFLPECKDVVIFPEKIKGKYYALNRPSPKSVGSLDIWLSESDNLQCWGNHRHLMGTRANKWDAARIGGGAVPILTQDGWLEIYHGMSPGGRYCLGGVLLDRDDPSKILARSEHPILEPEANYERNGFFGDVVFTCGGITEGDTLHLYYGVADRSMAAADLSIHEILSDLEKIC
ncbi:glycosidase [Sporolactobacillus sp. THM19-2]|nr:glycosidase [Sporolactobacillus sp. THM19-2]